MHIYNIFSYIIGSFCFVDKYKRLYLLIQVRKYQIDQYNRFEMNTLCINRSI